MKRIMIAKILAVVASVMGIIGICNVCFGEKTSEFLAMFIFLSPLMALVSYFLCGFFKALGTPFSLAKWGFIMAPFPVNLLAVVILFLVGILSVIYIPVVPVFKRAAELGY